DVAETPSENAPSDLAVATSLRPPVSPRRSPTEAAPQNDGASQFSGLESPERMESPLSAYGRNRTDLFVPQNNGQPGGAGFPGSGGNGNSDITNYAGRVLVHLNRAPSVRVSQPGSVRVLFAINPDGTLAKIDILDNTGSTELARAAKAQVRNAAPFPRPPDGTLRRLSFVYRSN
ncbi:TonB family protein, partial [Pseudophaeobacter sp.]|uniref:energy transducer TonB family protein n=1 Tax=Pseudophaeobacter sp. TaxID=1971739 RepID=UPI0032989FBD